MPFMPYGRTSAEQARKEGLAGVDYREAAVFMGLEPDGRLVLIERASGRRVHRHQMALPGGARERGESLVDCALREWREELGLGEDCVPRSVPVDLTEVHVVPSRFIVRPHLAHVDLDMDFDYDRSEVGAIHRIRLVDLLEDGHQCTRSVRVGGKKGFMLSAPGFALPGVPFIWGATAMMLGELKAILASVEG